MGWEVDTRNRLHSTCCTPVEYTTPRNCKFLKLSKLIEHRESDTLHKLVGGGALPSMLYYLFTPPCKQTSTLDYGQDLIAL